MIDKAERRSDRAPRAAAGWVVLGTICAVAAIRAWSVDQPVPYQIADEATRREAFQMMAEREPGMRDLSTWKFPGDLWSQDDEFHASEHMWAWSFANARQISIGDVLRAVDDGMREGWLRSSGVTMQPSVPPCRPRLIY